MPRTKGNIAFSGNFEPAISAPFDARMTVQTQADLYLTSTWLGLDSLGHSYVGMVVSVYADSNPLNNGLYQLVGTDVTVTSNWVKAGGTVKHDQQSLSAAWTINHNLNKYPNVTVIDSIGDMTNGAITYSSPNSITITFSSAITGVAYLS